MQVVGITDSVCASSVCFSVSYLSNCCARSYQNCCLTDSKGKRSRAEAVAGVEVCLSQNTLESVFP